MVYATEFFITISPRHEITTDTLEKVKKYTQKHLDINHIIIQENGKNGDHPHLHIYGSCKVQKRTNAFKINFITHLWKNELTPEERKHTIDIRKAHHIDKLLGWYFQKEEDSKLILNKGIDLANFKVKYEKTLQKVKYELPKCPCRCGTNPHCFSDELVVVEPAQVGVKHRAPPPRSGGSAGPCGR